MAFSDDFNRSNENLEASSDWTRVDGTAGGVGVVSNAVDRQTATATEEAYQCPDQGAVDQYVQVVQRATGTGVGGTGAAFPLCLRLTDKDNFVGARHFITSGPTPQWDLYKRVAGSFTLLGSYGAVAASGDVARLTMVGDVFTLYINGIARIVSGTETFNSGETRAGIVGRGAVISPWFDDFSHGSAVRSRIGFAGARMAGGRMG